MPTNTLDVGRAGPGGVSMFAFLPAKRTVPVGTTMTFRMQTGDFETHTVTTGPGDPSKDPKSYLGALTVNTTAIVDALSGGTSTCTPEP